MSRGGLWVLLAGLFACADGAVGDDPLLPPPDDMDQGRTFMPPTGDARPQVDASRLDLGRSDGPAPDARVEDPDASWQDARVDGAAGPDVGDAGDPADLGPDDLDGPPIDAEVVLQDAAVPDMAAPDMRVCPPEVCNGVDDDCDGRVDEGGDCGRWVQERCVLYAGWADSNRNPVGAVPAWGTCPPADRGEANATVRCTGTRRDGRFARLRLNGDVGGDDTLAVALRCDDAQDPALATYVQTHCALFMGWADSNRGPDGLAAWGACPNAIVSNVGNLRCTSTGFDGNFRALDLDGDVDENDDLGFAWQCNDAADPLRAETLSATVSVFVGWADNNRAPPDTSAIWGVCPGEPRGEIASQRCVSTAGDRRFHRLDLDGDVDENDAFGFALRAR